MKLETRNCQNCKNSFRIEPEDFAFYEKIKVPPPTFCPQCRLQRRLLWRNERTLYKRPCSLCGKQMVATYQEHTVFPVYCRSCWYSDKWDPLMYGREYDFSKDFFIQFQDLSNSVPRLGLCVDNSVNCEYTNQIANCKNCYLIFSAGDCEDCMYSYRIIYAKNVIDSFHAIRSEQCYEAVEARDSSRLLFSQNVTDGLDLLFCYDMGASNNCFMSSNVRYGSYMFRNRKLTKEDYTKELEKVDLGSYTKLEDCKKEYAELYRNSIHRFANMKNAKNSYGHALTNTQNAFYSFNGADLENCRYTFFVNYAKDGLDVNNGDEMELCYENSTNGLKAYNVKFSSDAWPDVRNLEYCDTCGGGSSDLFGCVSLRNKQYCILNKQYPKSDFLAYTEKIRKQMQNILHTDKQGRVYAYGEFFPSALSPYAYNESMASDWFPLVEAEASSSGYEWKEEAEKSPQIDLDAADLPDHIKDTDENIAGKTIACLHKGACNQKCSIGFRIISEEFKFYREKNIALPRLCPNCRHYERLKKLTGYNIYERQCNCDYVVHENFARHGSHETGRCSNKFFSPFAKDRPEIVYCEQCYQAEVI